MRKIAKKMAALVGKKSNEMTEEKTEQPIINAGKKAMALKEMMKKLKK